MELNNRILIVDDNAAIHDDFRKILSPIRSHEISHEYLDLEQALFEKGETKRRRPVANIEYDMEFAFQGDEALEKSLRAAREGRPYAIVFTDVRMPPGYDGMQLVARILEKLPYTEIVIVTAFSDYTWEEMTEKFGWTDRLLFLRKPFDVITVRQIALTLTKKWNLGAQARSLTRAMEANLSLLEKRVEERTARLAQANKDLQNFAYIVSHDLSSPLLSIQGFLGELRMSMDELEAIVEKALPNLSAGDRSRILATFREHVPESLDFIDTSVTKMDSLIKAILKLSRLGYRELHFEPIDMTALVDQNIRAMAYHIEKSGAKIIAKDLPQIVSDRLSMEQIIGNLLSNAVKFLDPRRPGEIRIEAEKTPEGVVFHLSDNGRGISKKDLPKIYDIFCRCGDHDVPGEGMGLAFVKTLVGQLSARIWCRSKEGEGTTFSLHIPDQPAHEMARGA
jgi:signal transduction histidine kinase